MTHIGDQLVHHKIFILIAAQFDERAVIDCVCAMREEGVSAKLVGIIPGLIKGGQGVYLKPDLSLSQLENDKLMSRKWVLVLPGGEDCVAALLAEPRVHFLIHSWVRADGLIAVMSPAHRLLAMIDVDCDKVGTRFFLEDRAHGSDFSQQLIHRLS